MAWLLRQRGAADRGASLVDQDAAAVGVIGGVGPGDERVRDLVVVASLGQIVAELAVADRSVALPAPSSASKVPLMMPPPRACPLCVGLRLLLPPTAWLSRNKVPSTVRSASLRIAPPPPIPAKAADAAVARLGQVTRERAVFDAGRAIVAEAAPQGIAGEGGERQRGTIGVVGSQRLVVGNGAVGDLQRAEILDSAAQTPAAGVLKMAEAAMTTLGSPTAWLPSMTTSSRVRLPRFRMPPPLLG